MSCVKKMRVPGAGTQIVIKLIDEFDEAAADELRAEGKISAPFVTLKFPYRFMGKQQYQCIVCENDRDATNWSAWVSKRAETARQAVRASGKKKK